MNTLGLRENKAPKWNQIRNKENKGHFGMLGFRGSEVQKRKQKQTSGLREPETPLRQNKDHKRGRKTKGKQDKKGGTHISRYEMEEASMQGITGPCVQIHIQWVPCATFVGRVVELCWTRNFL